MSEVLEQENAIILAAAQKFVALGSDIAQRSIAGQESGEQEEHSDKILKYLTVYRKGTSLETKALEAILYALRDLSEANIFPTVDPIVGQSIQYLVSQSATTISDTMQIQNKGSNLTLVDTINFDNFLTAAYDSGNSRVNLTLGGTASQNTTMTLGAFNLTLNASGAGGFGITFGSDADYDIFYRASGKWARLAFAGTDGHVLSRVGGVLAWAAQTSSGYDTIQNAGAGVTQRATVNFSGALQAIDDGSSKTNVTVKNAGITYAMIQNVTNSRLLGNATGSAAAPSEISVSGPLALGSSILSIAQAGASADGYLAASDWNAFNGKLGTSLNSGYLFVGSGINVATGVPMSGDASLASNGAITVTWANGYPTYDARYLTLSGGTLTGFLTLHADPSNAMHAATKNYVDNLITGISWKNEVVTATTANITLSGEQTIDGILTSGSRVLVKDQTTATENGIYLTGAGAWTRTTDADTGTEIAMATVYVAGGSTHGGTQWTCTNTAVTIGSTNISFGQISGTGTYTNGVGLTLTGNTFSITTNGVVNSLIRPSGALSVIGRSANSTGDVADISAFVDGDVLRRSGTTLGFGTIGNTSITGLAWSKLTGTPTTIAGYGITDGIGGSTGSVDNALLRANGTGGNTVQGSGSTATLSDTGVLSLLGASGYLTFDPVSSPMVIFPIQTTISAFKILAATGASGSTTGGDLQLFAGNAYGVGNTNGGHAYLKGGVRNGSGLSGNVGIGVTSVSDWQDMESGLFIGNASAAPTDNPSSGVFAWVSSTEPEGSNLKIRTSDGHFAKPTLYKKLTISSSSLQTIGTVPAEIIAAPGANKYINIISVSVSYKYNSTVFDFSGTEIPVFKISGGTAGFKIGTAIMNGAASFNRTLQVDASFTDHSLDTPTNTAFVLTTADGGNATTGDGDLDVVVYYTIETENP